MTDYSEITRTKISQPGKDYLEGPGVFDTGLDDHEGLNPYRYATVDLWFDGAPSDLSAEIEIDEDEQGYMFMTLRNIHVM